jgi:hypothetical protein
MAIVLVLRRLDRQTHTMPAGRQQARHRSFVPGSQDACLSRPPPSLTSHCCPWHPTHLLPTRTESVVRPHHRTHNACLLLLTNYAILRGYLPNHPTLSTLRLPKHRHYLEAPSTPPVIHLPLHRPPQTSFRCPMANFYLSSIVPRRFRTLSLPVQRTD